MAITGGRDHQEREQKLGVGRTRQTPEADSWEAETLASGRHGGVPPQHLVGAHTERYAGTNAIEALDDEDIDEGDEPEGEEPTGAGSDVAPTARAMERERERHMRERAIGHVPAGHDGEIRAQNAPTVTRDELNRAAQEADDVVTGHKPG